jgi:hypothetical protein
MQAVHLVKAAFAKRCEKMCAGLLVTLICCRVSYEAHYTAAVVLPCLCCSVLSTAELLRYGHMSTAGDIYAFGIMSEWTMEHLGVEVAGSRRAPKQCSGLSTLGEGEMELPLHMLPCCQSLTTGYFHHIVVLSGLV